LAAAVDLITTILDPGEEPRRTGHVDARYLKWRELHRIKDVSRRLALEVAAAVFCAVWDQPRLLPDDRESFSRAIARAVLKLREQSGYAVWDPRTHKLRKHRVHPPGALVVAPLGRELREALAPFFVQVSQALDAERVAPQPVQLQKGTNKWER
jgi:hypothetical protein